MPINIMLVDDSNIVRGLLRRALEQDPNFKIIANASDGKVAIDMARQYKPDVIILDIEMPNMDGITAIPLLLEVDPEVRIIMASKLTRKSASISMRALELGAADYIAKPEIDGLDDFYRDLRGKINALARKEKPTAPVPAQVLTKTPLPESDSEVKSRGDRTPSFAHLGKRATAPAPVMVPVAAPAVVVPRKLLESTLTTNAIRALAIASSTGGPQALMTVFSGLKGKPLHIPVFITQHMPALFTTVLAEHIATASGFPCREAKDGDIAEAGHIYVAPGDYHMVIHREGKNAVIHINKDPQVNFCRPSADPMFQSLSETYGKHLLAVVMTGMGRDGADGAQIIAKNGGVVVAQDEKTSIVYGMPKVVAERGVCQAILPLPDIAEFLLKNC